MKNILTAKSKAYSKTKWEKYLKSHGVRQSETRDKFFELMLEFPAHVELTELIERAKKNGIGEASVYRSLKLLMDAEIVTRIQGAGGRTFYEMAKDHHDHMICIQCGEIMEFQSEIIEKLQNEIAEKAGFSIQSHVHELLGYCSKCKT